MSYRIKTIPNFDKSLKRLVEKYASLKQKYIDLLDSLEVQSLQGTSLGNNCYKIRIAITSKGRGKVEVHELLHTSLLLIKQFSCLTSLINLSKTISVTRNFFLLLRK
jgi:hypothetical protein